MLLQMKQIFPKRTASMDFNLIGLLFHPPFLLNTEVVNLKKKKTPNFIYFSESATSNWQYSLNNAASKLNSASKSYIFKKT